MYLLLGRGEEREKERETSVWERYIYWLSLAHPQLGTQPTTQACVLTWNQTGDLWVPRPALSPLSHTSQGQDEISNKNLNLGLKREEKRWLQPWGRWPVLWMGFLGFLLVYSRSTPSFSFSVSEVSAKLCQDMKMEGWRSREFPLSH